MPLSWSAGATGLPLASTAGESSPELELELLLEPDAPGLAAVSGLSASPGNGKSFFAAGADGTLGASGADGAPLRLGVPESAGAGLLPLLSPGNGNFCIALGLLAGAGVVPHGSGCGVTEHGAGLSDGLLWAPHGIAANAPASTIAPRCLRIGNSLLHQFRRFPRGLGLLRDASKKMHTAVCYSQPS